MRKSEPKGATPSVHHFVGNGPPRSTIFLRSAGSSQDQTSQSWTWKAVSPAC